MLVAGDSFGIKDHERVEKARGHLIFDVYDLIGVAAHGMGELELLYGIEYLQALTAKHTFPMLCANLRYKQVGTSPFETHTVVNKGGKKLLITAVLGADTKLHKEGAGLDITDPVTAISEIQKSIAHDGFIVIAYVDHAAAEDLARKVAGIDLIVVGAQAGVRNGKRTVNGTRFVFSNMKGGVFSYVDARFDGQNNGISFSAPFNVSITIDKYEESHMVKSMIDNFKTNLQKEAKTHQVNIRGDLQRVARDGYFMGDRWCIRCHGEIYESWKATRHAHAMETLEKAGKADDAECLKCHATGRNNQNMWFARARGGFDNMETTPYLANVQCEACHGPAQLHTIKPQEFTFPGIGPGSCKRCHTQIRDGDFAFIRDKLKGTHRMGTTAAKSGGGAK